MVVSTLVRDFSSIVFIFLAAAIVTSCAARPARTVDVRQPHDEVMGCSQLASELSASRRMLLTYGTDRAQQSERNQLAILGVLVNPVILMNADAGDAADKEHGAYVARIAYLESLRAAKECSNE
jgi:hypothetical protein